MKIYSVIIASAILATSFASCSDKDEPQEQSHLVTLQNNFPEGMEHYTVMFNDMSVTFTELNTRQTYTTTASHMAASVNISLPTGIYDYSGVINYSQLLGDGSTKELALRAVGTSVTITGDQELFACLHRTNHQLACRPSRSRTYFYGYPTRRRDQF